eukprot:3580170-Amphidinium_carterae.1
MACAVWPEVANDLGRGRVPSAAQHQGIARDYFLASQSRSPAQEATLDTRSLRSLQADPVGGAGSSPCREFRVGWEAAPTPGGVSLHTPVGSELSLAQRSASPVREVPSGQALTPQRVSPLKEVEALKEVAFGRDRNQSHHSTNHLPSQASFASK